MSEFNVFLAAMRWVDADESREHFLDEVLGAIRFPTMDYEELGLVGKHPTAAGAAILKVGTLAVLIHFSVRSIHCCKVCSHNEELGLVEKHPTAAGAAILKVGALRVTACVWQVYIILHFLQSQ